MRIELVAALACAIMVSGCGGNVTGLQAGAYDAEAVYTSGWSSDPATPQGNSRAGAAPTGIPGTDCSDTAQTVPVDGQAQVMGGTSCTLSSDFN
jgi:hypothetical protein